MHVALGGLDTRPMRCSISSREYLFRVVDFDVLRSAYTHRPFQGMCAVLWSLVGCVSGRVSCVLFCCMVPHALRLYAISCDVRFSCLQLGVA